MNFFRITFYLRRCSTENVLGHQLARRLHAFNRGNILFHDFDPSLVIRVFKDIRLSDIYLGVGAAFAVVLLHIWRKIF